MDVNVMWTVQSLEKGMQAVSRDQNRFGMWTLLTKNSILGPTKQHPDSLASWHQVIFFEKCENRIKY